MSGVVGEHVGGCNDRCDGDSHYLLPCWRCSCGHDNTWHGGLPLMVRCGGCGVLALADPEGAGQ